MEKTLSNRVRFVIDVGTNGFNAWRQYDDGCLELFAASSSMSTFLKVMETIANWHDPEKGIRFASAERIDPLKPPLLTGDTVREHNDFEVGTPQHLVE
jgi:hypothetical protein